MNRLRYPYKFTLICLLFILPLTIVMFLLISDMNANIEFAEKEVQGNKYFRTLNHLLNHTLQARLITQLTDVGKTSAQAELTSLQGQIDEDIRAVETVDHELGAETGNTPTLAALKQKWQLLKERSFSDSDSLLIQMNDDIGHLVSRAGDAFNLVLDPSLDTYYPLNALLLKLPGFESRLVQIQSLGRSVLAKNSLSESEREQFINSLAVINSTLIEIQKGMDVAFKNNPSNNLQKSLEAALTGFIQDVSAFLVVVDQEFLRQPALTVKPDAFDTPANQAVKASFGLWDLTIVEVDNLLNSRIRQALRRKYLIETIAFFAILSIAYLLVGFYSSVMRTVSGLDVASRRMLEGDFAGKVSLETRDEMTYVVESFNNIAVRLRSERDQTKKINAELEAFAYSVSHDLRAPLRAMQGISEALLEDYGSQMDDTAQDYARRIVAAAAEMEELIQDLLEYSRLSRSEIQLRSIELSDVVFKARDQIAINIQDSRAVITTGDLNFTVVAHPATLVQIIANLLTNAVKFVDSGTKPIIRVTAHEQNGRVRLCVDDNGIGIAPEHQERIFRVFERLHGVETYPGSGIGLAIVRKGVSRMGGSFGVTSEVGKGSQFWIEFAGVVGNTNETRRIDHLAG